MSVEGINYYQNNYRIQAQKRANHSACRNNKKEKMPIERKIGIASLGALGCIYLAFIGLKLSIKTNPQKLQKSLSEIFMRDVSSNEVRQMQKKYTELLKINNPEEFTQKAFNEIKKDYGYENSNIKLRINYRGKISLPDVIKNPKKRTVWGMHDHINLSTIINLNCKPEDKLSFVNKVFVLNYLFHEIKHLQQSHLCYSYNKEKYFNSILGSMSELQKILAGPSPRETLEKNYLHAFKNVPKIDTKKHKNLIEKYIENKAHYKNGTENNSYKEYKQQLLEQEAFQAGKTGRQIIYNGIPTYKIPFGPLPKILVATSAGCFAVDGYKNYTNNNN